VGATVNFQNGEKVNFNGREATVISGHSYSNKITIQVDGKLITVDKNDLFGMKKTTKEPEDFYAKAINSCDEQIEHNKDIIETYKELWADAKAKIRECRNKMGSILKENRVSKFNQLDEGQKAIYMSFKSDKSAARATQIRATAGIISAAHSTASEAGYKHTLINEQYIASQC